MPGEAPERARDHDIESVRREEASRGRPQPYDSAAQNAGALSVKSYLQ